MTATHTPETAGTAARTLRVAAVLDGSGRAADRHAQALGGFLRDGLRPPAGVAVEAVTWLFRGADDQDRPDPAAVAAAALSTLETAAADAGGPDLFVFPGGPLGTELAARLTARSGGSVLTGVLDAEVGEDGLRCRRTVFSGHLMGTFTLGPRPWCITLDAGWADACPEPVEPAASPAAAPAIEHVVTITADAAPDAATAAFLPDVEWLEPPPTGDLETARFLVVAGRGAGSHGGVERIAAAAARLGAAFGVTRPVVMNAWATPDRQVGVSGTRTAPAACIVAGASGAPAFLWGVERAGFIAAIDTDEHAAIIAEADAAVIGDAVTVIETLADFTFCPRHQARH